MPLLPATMSVTPPRSPPAWLPLAAILLLSLVWGITWVLAKQALAHAPPFAFAAQRCVGSAVALLVVLRLSGRPLVLRQARSTVAISLTQVAGFMIFQTAALVANGPGKTSVLIFTMPIWTLLLAWLLLGERIRGLQWVAAAATLTGLVLIISPWNLHGGLAGDLYGVIAAWCWAIGSVLVKRLRARHAVDLLTLTAWQMLMASVPLVALALVVPERPTDWSWTYVALLLLVSLFSTSLGWWLWVWILDRVPAWEASLSVLGTPLVAILSSTLIMHERFVRNEVVGMMLIAAGIAFLSLVGYLNRPLPAQEPAG